MIAGMVLRSLLHVATQKPEVELADVLRLHLADYLQKYHCTAAEMRALTAIMNCRTALLGGHIRICDGCGQWEISYNSCKNRHCPKCGAFEQAQWLAKLEALLLPVPYYHVVFTTDHALNDLAYHNPEVIYTLLFQTASAVLKAYGQEYLGGDIGATMVLHTWGQTLQPHLHLHCMVTGGALFKTHDSYAWQASAQNFLFPVVKLAQDFRNAFCAGLLKLDRQGELRLIGHCAALDLPALVQEMVGKAWEVYIQKPVAGTAALTTYLGRYLQRTAIGNQRIQKLADGCVTFAYRDNRERGDDQRGKLKWMSLPAVEFIHRFVRHILPSGFVRVRHLGLHASGMRLKLQCARLLLGLAFALPKPPPLDLGQWLTKIGADDALRCPVCGVGTMQFARDFAPLRGFTLWLLLLLGLPVYDETTA